MFTFLKEAFQHRSARYLIALSALWLFPDASTAAQAPRSGGELVFAVAETPPSFDGHRETTFAMLHPIAPHYSTLLRFDPHNYPKIIGDVAEKWSFSRDGLTFTATLRKGIKFHDGTPLTAPDVKATYEKIIFPPEGVASARKASFAMVAKIEAPDELTVVFRLKHIAASFVANLASPWNFIYSADKLKKDPRWYEKNILGSGPFIFGEYVAGSHWTGKKNPNYYIPGRPYLDGFRAVFIRDSAPRVAAVRSGQALVEFRGFNPAARDDVVKSLGQKAVVQESPWACNLMVVFNNQKKPFDDARVRRALSLAIDRNEASKALSQISVMKFIGGVYRPGSAFATSPDELAKLPGFGKDPNAARAEARRLLKEAGVPENFSFVLKNRNVREPYEVTGVFVVDQWRKMGLNVTHTPQEGGAYFNDFRQGNYDAGIDFTCEFMDEPDLYLLKYLSSDKSPINYSRYKDAALDELYERQSRMLDLKDRLPLLRQIEKRAIAEQAYQFPVLWWQRIVPHHERLKGWKIGPSHYVNQDLRDVWLGQ